jgi:hypothetical protein
VHTTAITATKFSTNSSQNGSLDFSYPRITIYAHAKEHIPTAEIYTESKWRAVVKISNLESSSLVVVSAESGWASLSVRHIGPFWNLKVSGAILGMGKRID